MKIETERLIIRSIQATDLESLAKLWIDPDVTYYMGGPRNYEEVLKSLEEDVQVELQPTFTYGLLLKKKLGR